MLVAVLGLAASACGSEQASGPGTPLSRELEIADGSAVLVGPVHGTTAGRELSGGHGRSWRAWLEVEDKPLEVFEAYAEQLEDAGYELRSVGRAACVQRWNRGQEVTQETPLGSPLPRDVEQVVGAHCHIVGLRGPIAVSLYMNRPPSNEAWVVRVERFQAQPGEFVGLQGYAEPSGELPSRGKDLDASAHPFGFAPKVNVRPEDRLVARGMLFEVRSWGCGNGVATILESDESAAKVMDHYLETLAETGVVIADRHDRPGEVAAVGAVPADGPTFELWAKDVPTGDSRLLVEACSG